MAASGERIRHCTPTRVRSGTFISGSFATNAIGTLTFDPSDTSGNTIYAGTGEPNASADSEAGFGIYKSTNGGNTWTHLASHTMFRLAQVSIAMQCSACHPEHLVFARLPRIPVPHSTAVQFPRSLSIQAIQIPFTFPPFGAVRGISSVLSGGVVTLAPGLPPYGFWKSTDGGANFTLTELPGRLPEPDPPGQRRNHPGKFRFNAGCSRERARPRLIKYSLCRSVPAKQCDPAQYKGWRLAFDR